MKKFSTLIIFTLFYTYVYGQQVDLNKDSLQLYHTDSLLIKNSGNKNLIITQLYTVTSHYSYNTKIVTKDSSFGFVMRDLFTQTPNNLDIKLVPNDSAKITLTITDLCNICKRSSIKLDFTDTLIIKSNSLTMDSIRVFIKGDGTSSALEGEKISPLNFALYQNFPNPFNPSTTIKYQLENSKHVVLKIFDMLGRTVKELINKDQDKGNYNVKFYADDLPSGTYFYQLGIDNRIITKKMLLLK